MCPTYLNSGTDAAIISGVRMEPGIPKESTIHISASDIYEYNLQNDNMNVTQTAVIPVFDNVLDSQLVAASSTIVIPESIKQNYKVKVFCSAGSVAFKLNNSGSVSQYLAAGDYIEIGCSEREIASLIFVISSGTATVTTYKN